MGRPVTLFTGQWADLPFETICEKALEFGYDGLELCTWGDHMEIDKPIRRIAMLETKRWLNTIFGYSPSRPTWLDNAFATRLTNGIKVFYLIIYGVMAIRKVCANGRLPKSSKPGKWPKCLDWTL